LCGATAIELMHTPATNEPIIVRQNAPIGDNEHLHEDAVVSAMPSVALPGTSGTTTTTPRPIYAPEITNGPPIQGAPWFHRSPARGS
jgi:hypothetical protein